MRLNQEITETELKKRGYEDSLMVSGDIKVFTNLEKGFNLIVEVLDSARYLITSIYNKDKCL